MLCRAEYIISNMLQLPASRNPPSYQSALLVGGPGTAKTSTALMFLSKYKLSEVLWKRINLSSATTPERFQQTIEAELERKTGKTYCPPTGKQMTFFLDDMSMPFVNSWGDQVTLELGRQLIEQGGMYFLDKDKRYIHPATTSTQRHPSQSIRGERARERDRQTLTRRLSRLSLCVLVARVRIQVYRDTYMYSYICVRLQVYTYP